MNTKDLFDLKGIITVRKNYAGDITIPNVPGIDDEGGHDDWRTTIYFSCEEDLNNLITQGCRPWFEEYSFPFGIVDNGDGCVSISYTGARAYEIAQRLVTVDSGDDCCGMDSLITWLCNIINPIIDHIDSNSGKVIVITEDVITEMSREEAYTIVRKVLDFKELSDYPKAEEALRVAAHCMEHALGMEYIEDDFNVSGWDAVYDLRDLIEDDDYEDIIIVRKHRKAIEKAYRCLRASI